MSELDRNRYTVAWIAPLYIEARAALLMLDQRHEGHFPVSRGDDYIYLAGSMCGHDVVIATLPAGQEYGNGSAAALASQLKAFFPNLQVGILVGVAAGLPDLSRQPPRDIRLGDVLVAIPEGDTAGLVAYDLGKDLGRDGFRPLRLGHALAQTKTIVRSAIGNIRLNAPNDAQSFLPYYQQIRDEEHVDGDFRDPGQDQDVLYEFDQEGIARKVTRESRSSQKRTRVWYGPIGSGEKLMRNSRQRNELRDKYNIIGLEMEAAGTINRIPVGVIRGVCDYGDEHKNKKWQPYAAAMAAAYAKAVLQRMPPDAQDRMAFADGESHTGKDNDVIQQNHFISKHLEHVAIWRNKRPRVADDYNGDSESSLVTDQPSSRRTKRPVDVGCSWRSEESQSSSCSRSIKTSHRNWPRYQTERPGLSAKYLDRHDSPPQLLPNSDTWRTSDRRSPHIVVVYGLSGVGKSQMCLNAITEQQQRFLGVFYVDLSSKETADINYIDISRVCQVQHHWEGINLEEQIRITRAWLACQNKPWLLMIDNADSNDFHLDRYIPSGGHGTILITTTDKRLTNCGHTSCKIGSMDDHEAFDLLMKYKCTEADVDVQELELAKTLAIQVLGGLPLAIAQAGAYIFNNQCTYAEYLEELKESPQDLLGESASFKQFSRHHRPIWSTLAMSVRRIQMFPERGSTEAIELLRTMSFLHNESISDRLFQEAWKNMKDVSFFTRPVTFLDPSKSRWDTSVIRAAIGILCRYSLLNPAASSARQYSMHKIVQTICRNLLCPAEQINYALTAACLLGTALAGIKTPLSWIEDPSGLDLQKLVLPHIRSCIDGQLEILFDNLSEGALDVGTQILLLFSKALSATGHYENAQNLLEKGWTVLTTNGYHKRQTSAVLKLMEQRAVCETHMNKHAEAFMIRQDICVALEKISPTHSDDRCVAMMNIADSMWALGRREEALLKAEKCLQIRESTLVLSDLRLSRTRRKVAEFLFGLNYKRRSRELRELVFTQTLLEKAHTVVKLLDSLATKTALADSYHSDGRYLAALELRQDVYQGRNTILGPEHPETLLAHGRLLITQGALTSDSKRQQTICQLWEKSVIIWKRTLGEMHPLTLGAKVHMGRSYSKVGDFAKALITQESVLNFRRRLFAENPDTERVHLFNYLSSMAAVASLMGKTGKLPKALKMRERVAKIAESHCGREHPVTFNAFNKLLNCEAIVHCHTGEELMNKRLAILDDQRTRLSPDDASILKTMSFLAIDYENRGQMVLASNVRRDLLGAQRLSTGLETQEAVNNMKSLTSLLKGIKVAGLTEKSYDQEATDLVAQAESFQRILEAGHCDNGKAASLPPLLPLPGLRAADESDLVPVEVIGAFEERETSSGDDNSHIIQRISLPSRQAGSSRSSTRNRLNTRSTHPFLKRSYDDSSSDHTIGESGSETSGGFDTSDDSKSKAVEVTNEKDKADRRREILHQWFAEHLDEPEFEASVATNKPDEVGRAREKEDMFWKWDASTQNWFHEDSLTGSIIWAPRQLD